MIKQPLINELATDIKSKNIMPGIDGMVHISQLSNERVEKVNK